MDWVLDKDMKMRREVEMDHVLESLLCKICILSGDFQYRGTCCDGRVAAVEVDNSKVG